MSTAQLSTAENAGQEFEALRVLAGALNGHLKPQLDESRVGEIVDEKISQARMPRPVEVRIAGREA